MPQAASAVYNSLRILASGAGILILPPQSILCIDAGRFQALGGS
jgi:hypothetical protein